MSENNLKNILQTNLEAFEKMTDEKPNVSYILLLDETFLAEANLRIPKDIVALMFSTDKIIGDRLSSARRRI